MSVNLDKLKEDVLHRMSNDGDYLIQGIGGYFWANVNHDGCLIETASSEEVMIVINLCNVGIVKLETSVRYESY